MAIPGGEINPLFDSVQISYKLRNGRPIVDFLAIFFGMFGF